MSDYPIIRAGHPVLRQIAKPVEDPTAPEIAQLVEIMERRMAEAGGVGLAAPQIAVSKRVVLFFVPDRRLSGLDGDYPLPLTALINPVIEKLGDETDVDWEGCLSLPGLRGLVPRHTHIRYTGYTPQGEFIDRQVSGFHARVVQHEFDHLDGVLYPGRMTDLLSLGFTEEIAARMEEEAFAAE